MPTRRCSRVPIHVRIVRTTQITQTLIRVMSGTPTRILLVIVALAFFQVLQADDTARRQLLEELQFQSADERARTLLEFCTSQTRSMMLSS